MNQKKPILTNSKPCFKEFRSGKNKILQNLGAPHLESFDYFLEHGMKDCLNKLNPLEFELINGEKLCLQIEDCNISTPEVRTEMIDVVTKKIYPTECRQRAATYSGMVNISLAWSKNGNKQQSVNFDLGEIPLMVKSKVCNLYNASPERLVEHNEHESEWGGYFVVKGHEKLIRMLLMTRRNYPLSIKRSTWKDRGRFFSEYGIFIRCVQSDQTSTNNVLHFLNNGTAKIMFSHQKALSYVPVMLILKSLVNYTDEKIYKELVNGFESDQYYKSCLQSMLMELHEQGLHTHKNCRNYMGQVFRPRYPNLPDWYSNEEVCDFLQDNNILIHLKSNVDKFNLIVFMLKKLFQVVQGKSKLEGADCVMMQELLLGGHLYQKMFKEFLERWMIGLKFNLTKKADANETLSVKGGDILLAGKYASNISRHFEHFLSTGNLISKSGLGLMQNSGLVILAENINRMRYMSHFRAVHRGSYFVEMRTTEARQLLPDAWGFICPVHTPDGSPCGLLNHLTVDCVASKDIMHDEEIVTGIPLLLAELGMVPINSLMPYNLEDYYTVMLEGCVIGYLKIDRAVQVTNYLRGLKIEGKKLPDTTEIVLVQKKLCGQYPGLFLFVGSARMMRPVWNLAHQKIEMIGTFEQVYLDIAIKKEEMYENVTTHLELSKLSFLSNLANLIPMPDCNQSPRNMYQCQMGKQTMGTPCHNWMGQAQTKLYRLQTPATPLFRPVHHDKIELDDFAMGTNAIVAVISYTGYDMEDAMIINKSAYERGFAHGCIYHSDFVELTSDSYFARDPKKENLALFLDSDGLPHPGQKLHYGDPLYCYFDMDENIFRIKKFEGKEMVVVDNVKQCGTMSLSAPKKACITTRIPRNPSVGDKFASRAGQKGICSQKWPAEDLPFTESGMIPDILFNPHGFPSRMTIAMMIETMAGKTGSLRGEVHDATPFIFDEQNTAIDYFGQQLTECGYNYFGTERMYSGVDGREMKADIFFGVVHYQRLRHMVSDKWQVRSTGPIDVITHQPIKGRKKGGGVRFGEMERDALIAHGASFLLQDRLLHCSDKTTALICRDCCSLLGPMDRIEKRSQKSVIDVKPETCRLCGSGDNIGIIEIPYVFKYLVTQLSSMNIDVKLNYKQTI